jgi:hypothetical protein
MATLEYSLEGSSNIPIPAPRSASSGVRRSSLRHSYIEELANQRTREIMPKCNESSTAAGWCVRVCNARCKSYSQEGKENSSINA